MSRTYDKPIIIQRIDEASEKWEDVYNLHAKTNKAKADSEYLSSGAIQNKVSLLFEVRFFNGLKDIRLNTQNYRVMYENTPYNVVDYDDYQENHRIIKLLGVSY